MVFPSRLVEDAVNEFARLPGIGKKTALRLVLHLLKQETEDVERFSIALSKMRNEILFCKQCHVISDHEICEICSNPSRDQSILIVVEDLRDQIAVENTNHFNCLYHLLGGVISPVNGIGPDELNINSLIDRVEKNPEIKELIMALNPTIEGDTTIFYISRRLKNSKVKISTIARGVAFGGELEYTDEVTLARSISTRQPYENYLTKH